MVEFLTFVAHLVWFVTLQLYLVVSYVNSTVQDLYQLTIAWWDFLFVPELKRRINFKKTLAQKLAGKQEKELNTFDGLVEIKKLPQHLAVVLPTDFESFFKIKPIPFHLASVDYLLKKQRLLLTIQNLTYWSLMFNIKQLSIYSKNNNFKKFIKDIVECLADSKILNKFAQRPIDIVISCDQYIYKLHSHGGFSCDSRSNLSKVSCDIHINIISKEDGFSKLVQLTKDLSYLTGRNEIKKEQINSKFIVNRLKDEFLSSDPQVLLVFGKNLVVNEFPCWKLRQSEIYLTNSNVASYIGFARVMHRYSTSTQRLGK